MTEFEKRVLAIIIVGYFILCVITLIILLWECERNGRSWRR